MTRNLTILLVVIAIFSFSCSGKKEQQTINFRGTFFEKRWALKELNCDLPSDWSASGYLTFEFNSSSTQRFELCLHDKRGLRKLEILPFQGVWVRASVPLIHFQKMNTEGMDQAAIWKTPRPGYWIGFTGMVGPINNIDSLGIAMNLPVGLPLLEVRNFRLTTAPEDTIFTATPLVDEFGQWIPDEWQGKAKNLNDLKNDWTAEEELLHEGITGNSRYGGFAGTYTRSTGFFHTKKIDAIWWLVDPDGLLFYSNGSCCIGPGSDLARIKGREYIFNSLPPDDGKHMHQDEGNDHISSFYTWNLSRRFGDSWYEKWIKLTSLRMNYWGLNTVGNWSDPEIGKSHLKAYVSTLSGWGIENGKMGMPDIYASGYLEMVDSAASNQCAPLKNDPYLLGYFIGNEPAWPGRETELAESILTGDDTPMKEALKKYLSSGDSPEKRRAFAYETFSGFLTTVCAAIKKYDPHHLNLGLRFGDPPSAELITECKKHFDVFSINHYGYSVSHEVVDKIYQLTGLPVIIGEFHFGIPRRGLAPGLAQVRNPEERGAAYSYYVENAASHPAVIGTHWFQWIDQPSTGRMDGENYNIGFVDVTDRPYPEMVEACRLTFSRLFDVHSGKMPPIRRQALVQ